MGQLRQFIIQLWEWATHPAARLTDHHQQRQARTTAALLLALIAFLMLISIWGVPTFLPLVLMTGCYIASRTPYYQIGGFFALLTLSYPPFALVIIGQASSTGSIAVTLNWLILPVILSNLILPINGMVAIIALNVGGMALLQSLQPDLPPQEIFTSVALVATVSVLITLTSMIERWYLVQMRFIELQAAQVELERANRELNSANQDIKDFAQIVAHDLRAPLVNIDGFMHEVRYALKEMQPVIDKSLTEPLDDRDREILRENLHENLPNAIDFIDVSTNKMDHLITQILKLARAGRRELVYETVDTNQIVQQVVGTLSHKLEMSHSQVHWSALPVVWGDKLALEQIFTNLLDNAVKYLDPQRPGRIIISAEPHRHETIFHIADNGRGIAEHDYDKVFQPFRRGGNLDQVRGEGIGLPYIQTLLRRHGGRIWFTSQLNIGTTFSFAIPNQTEQASNRS